MQMNPGRELDALVAERVMGCKPIIGKTLFYTGLHCSCPDSPHDDSDDEGIVSWLKDYSTDIAASWEVVEKLRSKRMMISIVSEEDGGWIVDMWDYNLSQSKEVFSESLPHAMCLSALKAVGYQFPTS